ncbi:hypothetical protein PF010_g28199 [Phytophthora fragariae]|nr:hypothetical protein PF010_g28199 [Phytophthora fragariae]KAE9141545.1 hypothetical protein PF006_g13169 [Phytophthora fragariae]KAE9173922.1 hypothetical protein PF002_g29192 [Phytophthora fragariae]
MLYTHVSDINFLNATSLTRSAFHQLLRRFSRFYYIPRSTARGRPPKLRHYHQIMGLLVEAREPLFKHTFGFIDGKNLRVQQPSNADLQNAIILLQTFCDGEPNSMLVRLAHDFTEMCTQYEKYA